MKITKMSVDSATLTLEVEASAQWKHVRDGIAQRLGVQSIKLAKSQEMAKPLESSIRLSCASRVDTNTMPAPTTDPGAAPTPPTKTAAKKDEA